MPDSITPNLDIPTVTAPVLVIPDSTPDSISAPTSNERRAFTPSPTVASSTSSGGDTRDSTTVIKSLESRAADRAAALAEVVAAGLRTEGQRKVNFIWEYTQATIAVAVVVACIIAAFLLEPAKAEILRNAFFLIVGFYFGRTNHQITGGVGSKEPLQQSGR